MANPNSQKLLASFDLPRLTGRSAPPALPYPVFASLPTFIGFWDKSEVFEKFLKISLAKLADVGFIKRKA
jgi:hypothetical protein